mmetsp:Transcript_2456/g.3849  ORF Transcript_2456/g.3849 Transcript_2456/m.3849 type:complete len:108 (+) Transcript_2456:107-430(+)|eukprot:CAMPEP_0174957412 /NCGR_PEP_ID=MMETSP0004_2-20121128/2058_1 /TAXON_ID=420556 /ORGANISM="Ochromonas sp., Strain CCMP1393" /LENGTH=107 /DNA_ID=CAMNT_0016205519 /DNA_START=107 /DNA_END=430 /DNA_ORIENTATION=+
MADGGEEASEKRRINRTLTQRYDMGALRALQTLEGAFLEKLAEVYGCEEDDVPVEIDLLNIYNQDESVRPGMLQDILKDAPGDCSGLISKLVEDMLAVKGQLPTGAK